jgi:hypothetical protein
MFNYELQTLAVIEREYQVANKIQLIQTYFNIATHCKIEILQLCTLFSCASLCIIPYRCCP